MKVNNFNNMTHNVDSDREKEGKNNRKIKEK